MADPTEVFEIFDEQNKLIGTERRDVVHKKGYFHRSVNILLWNGKGELLLQKRSVKKDVCPGRWDVSCAEHLQPGETYSQAAARGLKEELGIIVQPEMLKRVKSARLHVTEEASKGVLDREFNETFEIGDVSSELNVDAEEVAGVRWVTLAVLHAELKSWPQSFTTWFVADYSLLLADRK